MLFVRCAVLAALGILSALSILIYSTKRNLCTGSCDCRERVTEKTLVELTHQRPTAADAGGRFSLDFVPRPPSHFVDCDDLFTATPFDMSADYWSLHDEFQAAIKEAKRGHTANEGSSGPKVKQTMALHYLAGRPSVRHVCEIGFNLGHSSFSFLTAKKDVVVHSFDLGRHHYSKIMSKFMAERFPGRFFIHFGYSSKTVPEFIRANRKFRCDLMLVDGGHTYAAARGDLQHFVSIGNRSNANNAIVFDDYPTLHVIGNRIGRAWENLIRSRSVVELMRCMFTNLKAEPPSNLYGQYQQGFVIGRLRPK